MQSEPTENQCECTAAPCSPVVGSKATTEYVPRRTRRDDTRMTRRERVLARIRDTPPGFVRAYGDVSPGAPRFAGSVLADCDDPDVPWHRIVRADGSLAKGERQRRLLAAEGVPFRGERVDMRTARLP
jgi:methylated-DNA-protein-cysteine methyltransferase-like protein